MLRSDGAGVAAVTHTEREDLIDTIKQRLNTQLPDTQHLLFRLVVDLQERVLELEGEKT